MLAITALGMRIAIGAILLSIILAILPPVTTLPLGMSDALVQAWDWLAWINVGIFPITTFITVFLLSITFKGGVMIYKLIKLVRTFLPSAGGSSE